MTLKIRWWINTMNLVNIIFLQLMFVALIQTTVCFILGELKYKNNLNGNDSKDAKWNETHVRQKRSVMVLCYKTNSGTQPRSIGTVNECVQYCWYERYKLALLGRGQKCKCANDQNQLTYVSMSNCRTKCAKNERQNCGGRNAYSMYKTGYEKEPPGYKDEHGRLVTPGEASCYRKSQSAHPHLLLFTKRMTPTLCVGYCFKHSYNYASVYGGFRCDCTLKMNHLSRTGDGSCYIPCAGDPRSRCGGESEIRSLYKTSIRHNFRQSKRAGPMPKWAKPDDKGENGYNYFKPKPTPKPPSFSFGFSNSEETRARVAKERRIAREYQMARERKRKAEKSRKTKAERKRLRIERKKKAEQERKRKADINYRKEQARKNREIQQEANRIKEQLEQETRKRDREELKKENKESSGKDKHTKIHTENKINGGKRKGFEKMMEASEKNRKVFDAKVKDAKKKISGTGNALIVLVVLIVLGVVSVLILAIIRFVRQRKAAEGGKKKGGKKDKKKGKKKKKKDASDSD